MPFKPPTYSPPERRWKHRFSRILILVALVWPFSWATAADSEAVRRQMVGLSFFPNVIAVDEDILTKRTETGALNLVLVFRDRRNWAEKLADTLEKKVKTIRGASVRILVTATPEDVASLAGVFLTEWLPETEFERIVSLGIERRAIVFSPHIGDVQRGATAGLYIDTRIRPSLNLKTLEKSEIRINPIFRRLSKHYD